VALAILKLPEFLKVLKVLQIHLCLASQVRLLRHLYLASQLCLASQLRLAHLLCPVLQACLAIHFCQDCLHCPEVHVHLASHRCLLAHFCPVTHFCPLRHLRHLHHPCPERQSSQLRLKRQSSPSRLEYLVDLGVRGARLFPSLALALVSVLVMVLVFFFALRRRRRCFASGFAGVGAAGFLLRRRLRLAPVISNWSF
jgi:hypothetical protein